MIEELMNNARFGELAGENVEEFRHAIKNIKDAWYLAAAAVQNQSVVLIANDQISKWVHLDEIINRKIFDKYPNFSMVNNLFDDAITEIGMFSPFSDYWRDCMSVGEEEHINYLINPMQDDEVKFRLSSYYAVAIAANYYSSEGGLTGVGPSSIEKKIFQIRGEIENVSHQILDFNGRVTAIDKEFHAKVAKVDNNIESISREYLEKLDNIAEVSRSENDRLSSEFKDKYEQYNATLEAMETELALQEPVRQWNADIDRHEKSAARALKWAIGLAIGTTLMSPFVGFSAHYLAGKFLDDPTNKIPILVFTAVSTLIFLTFGTWAVRVAVRYHMAEQHLKNDCRNRVAVTDAFVKLQGNTLATAEDIKILLQSIMRPVQDGIVQDDGLPNGHLAAMLVQFLDPRKPAT